MELKVGDYVRTHGYIDKIININNLREPSMKYALEQPSWNDDVIFIGKEDITKSSPNIIDLIEVGDYVNGCLVSKIKDKWWILNYADDETYEQLERKIENIKSIVTKEQFEAMKYVVKED